MKGLIMGGWERHSGLVFVSRRKIRFHCGGSMTISWTEALSLRSDYKEICRSVRVVVHLVEPTFP